MNRTAFTRGMQGLLAAFALLGNACAFATSTATPTAALAEIAQLRVSTEMIWLVTASVLVFFMQTGFALLESGMCRSKNSINVLMKNYFDMCFGALILWLVWFGFNGGSVVGTDAGLGRVVLNTHLAGAAGAIGAVSLLLGVRRPLLMTAAVNGSLAGLVSITAGAHVMDPFWAVVTGLLAGAFSVVALWVLEWRRVDDVVGASSVHAVGGVWGTLVVALQPRGHLV
jgi:ammonia channel protein AmtB